jgi:hypothetical protein
MEITPMDTKSKNPKSPDEEETPSPSTESRKEIPLVSVPNDQDMIAEEMAELFEEDQVTHKHGGTEPEGD